jgi:hypothetical protein
MTSNDDGAFDDGRLHADTPVCCTRATEDQKKRASLWPFPKNPGALQKSHRLVRRRYGPKEIEHASARQQRPHDIVKMLRGVLK